MVSFGVGYWIVVVVDVVVVGVVVVVVVVVGVVVGVFVVVVVVVVDVVYRIHHVWADIHSIGDHIPPTHEPMSCRWL